MGNKLYEENHIRNIANAIRGKTGKTATMKVSEMSGEIIGITTKSEIVLQEKTVTENGTVIPDSGYDGLSKVNVSVESSGGGSGGSGSISALNIHYGDTEPTDTSKLWCKCSEPSSVMVSAELIGEEYLETLSAKLPTGCYDVGVGVVGTKIYLFGGYPNGGKLNTINVFDTTTGTVTTLSATLPTQCSGMGVGVVGTKIYLFGGPSGGYLNGIYVFDTITETLTTLETTLPTASDLMGVGVVGTKIYLFGGEGGLKTINVFDTTTETITTLGTTLPVNNYGMGVGVVGTKIYLFGGYNSSELKTIYVFDTVTETITTLGVTLPTACYNMGAGVVGTKIYLFGGRASSRLNTINVFDTVTETLTTLDTTLSSGRFGVRTGVIGDKIYLLGGYSGSFISAISQLVVSFELENGKLQIMPDLTTNVFDLLKGDATIKLGVVTVVLGNSENVGELIDSYLYQNGAWTQI